MRKILREIVVNDIIYKWWTGDHNCDGDGGYVLKIWKDKKIIYQGLFHGKITTPKIVAKMIESIESQK